MPLAPPPECTYPTVDACYRDVQAHAKVELYCIILQVKRQGRHDICCDRNGIHKATAQLRRGTETKKTGCKFRAVLHHDKQENIWRLRVANPYHNHPPSNSPAVHAKHRQEEREIQRPLIERGMARGDTTKTIYENILAAYPGTITQFADVGNMVQGLKKVMALQASGSSAVAPPQQQQDQQPDHEFGDVADTSIANMASTPTQSTPIPLKYKSTRIDLTVTEDLRKAKVELARTSEITRALQDRVDFLEKERGSLEWRVGRLEAALFHVAGQSMAHGAAFAQPPPSTVHHPPVGPRWGGQGILYPVRPPQPATQVVARGNVPVTGGLQAQPQHHHPAQQHHQPQQSRQAQPHHQSEPPHPCPSQQSDQMLSQPQPQTQPPLQLQDQRSSQHTFLASTTASRTSAASQPIQIDHDEEEQEQEQHQDESDSNGDNNDDDGEEQENDISEAE